MTRVQCLSTALIQSPSVLNFSSRWICNAQDILSWAPGLDVVDDPQQINIPRRCVPQVRITAKWVAFEWIGIGQWALFWVAGDQLSRGRPQCRSDRYWSDRTKAP